MGFRGKRREKEREELPIGRYLFPLYVLDIALSNIFILLFDVVVILVTFLFFLLWRTKLI